MHLVILRPLEIGEERAHNPVRLEGRRGYVLGDRGRVNAHQEAPVLG